MIARVLVLLCAAACAGDSGGTPPVERPDPPVEEAPAEVEVVQVNEPGQVVTLDEILVPGKVVVLDFWADWCGACKVMEEKLVRDLQGVAGVVVRKLDIVDDVSPVAVHYRVGRSLPEMWIFDRDGNRVHQLHGGEVKEAGRLAKELAGGQ